MKVPKALSCIFLHWLKKADGRTPQSMPTSGFALNKSVQKAFATELHSPAGYSLSGAVLNRPYSSRPAETLCGSIVVNIPEWKSFSNVGSRNAKRVVGFGDGAPNNPWATWTCLIPGKWIMSRKAGKSQMLTALSSSLSFGCWSSPDPPCNAIGFFI